MKGDTAETTAAAIRAEGGRAESGAVDITDEAGRGRRARRGGRRRTATLDGLVCTPAINVRKSILKYSGEEFDRVVKVNLRGNFNVLMAAGRIMTAQKSGSIVLFSSIRSIVTEPGQAVYSMTKAGILQLAKTAATEWAEQGVRVNAVGPGVIETPLTAPIKAVPEWYKAYADKNPMRRWAPRRRDGRAHGVPAVGRRQLRHRHDPLRRRRLAGRRRAVHAAGDVDARQRLAAD